MRINLQITYCFFSFILFPVTVSAQSFTAEERKKIILDQVKPEHLIINQNFKNHKQYLSNYKDQKIVNKENIKEKVSFYTNGGAQFENIIAIKGLDNSMGYIDLFKMENGNTYKISVVRGKSYFIKKTMSDFIHDKLSQKNRLQGIMIEATAGGLNLSGFKEKKPISTKSKNILQHVLGVDTE